MEKESPGSLLRHLKEAKGFFDFMCDFYLNNNEDNVGGEVKNNKGQIVGVNKNGVRDILSKLILIKSEIVKGGYVKELSFRTGIREEDLWGEVKIILNEGDKNGKEERGAGYV